jgi:hypothetical protein
MKTVVFFAATCPLCGRAPNSPGMQARNERGRMVQGCVDEFHTGHVFGEAARWHNRPEAKKLRATLKTGRMGGVTHYARQASC